MTKTSVPTFHTYTALITPIHRGYRSETLEQGGDAVQWVTGPLVGAEVYEKPKGTLSVRVTLYHMTGAILPGLPAITTDALSVGSGKYGSVT